MASESVEEQYRIRRAAESGGWVWLDGECNWRRSRRCSFIYQSPLQAANVAKVLGGQVVAYEVREVGVVG